MAAISYAVVLEGEPDGSAVNVIVPALPEVATFGRTREEALRMAEDAIRLSIAYRRDNGLEIPPGDADFTQLERISIPLPAA